MRQDGSPPDVTDLLARAAKVDRAEVTRNERLRNDLGLDALALIDLVLAAEVRIPDEDVDGLRTVGDVVDYTCAAPSAA